MVDREKVIKALECCAYKQNCIECPYYKGNSTCMDDKDKDALELLKEQEDLGTELTNAVELIRKKNKRIEELLKEQKAVEHKTGHWIFESQYCEAWSHTCSECGKRMTTAVNTFANWCWNCGAKMEGGEMK